MNFSVSAILSPRLSAYINLRLHGKDVSLDLLFFFNSAGHREIFPAHTSTTISVLSLVDYDGQGNPVRLHPGLGDLPLYPEKDGWYSVLGSWNAPTSDGHDQPQS